MRAALLTERRAPAATNPATSTVLCLDCDPFQRVILQELIRSCDYEALGAESPGIAFEVLARTEIPIVLVGLDDLGMPAASLLTALRRLRPNALILVYSRASDEAAQAVCHSGLAFDYIETPIPRDALEILLNSVRHVIEEQSARTDFGALSEDRLRLKLEWMIWKEKQKIKHRVGAEKSLLANLRHSMAQGFGFGGLITQIELLQMMARGDGTDVTVPAQMFSTLCQSGEHLQNWFENLQWLGEVFSKRYASERLGRTNLDALVATAVDSTAKFRKIKGHVVQTAPAALSFEVRGNRELLQLTLEELLTNAYKYSPDGSQIDIVHFQSRGFASIVVLNDIQHIAGATTGIPEDLESLVFEPFYRINNVYDDRFRDERLGMGIGLTVVQNALNQIGGHALIFEITDYASGRKPRRRVAAEIALALNPSETTH